jgi:hypothetical protein
MFCVVYFPRLFRFYVVQMLYERVVITPDPPQQLFLFLYRVLFVIVSLVCRSFTIPRFNDVFARPRLLAQDLSCLPDFVGAVLRSLTGDISTIFSFNIMLHIVHCICMLAPGLLPQGEVSTAVDILQEGKKAD